MIKLHLIDWEIKHFLYIKQILEKSQDMNSLSEKLSRTVEELTKKQKILK